MIINHPFKISLDNNLSVAEGTALANSMVGQVLMTKARSPKNLGEYHPDPDFGCLLYTLQESTDPDSVIETLARGYVASAFKKWLPGFAFRVEVIKVEASINVRTFWSYLKFQSEVTYEIKRGN